MSKIVFEDVKHKAMWDFVINYVETDFDDVAVNLDELKDSFVVSSDDFSMDNSCYMCEYGKVVRINSFKSVSRCHYCPAKLDEKCKEPCFCLNGNYRYCYALFEMLTAANVCNTMPKTMYDSAKEEFFRVAKLIRDWPIREDVLCRSQLTK